MAYYGRMEIMRMPDEEIKRILEEEGDTLDEGCAALMIEELKNRREQPETPDLGLDEEEIAELNAEADEEGEGEQAEEDETDPDGELTDEEKIEKMRKEIEAQNKDSKKTLIIACAAAGVVAVGAIVAIAVLSALGKL